MRIVVGTRGSKLAVWQADWVRKQLTAAGHDVEICRIKTTGDRLSEAANLAFEAGGKEVFIKEIEDALLQGHVDVAVHSLKDLPVDQPPGLYVVSIPRREDPRDALISRDGRSFREIPPGARIGTSSLRRQLQLLHLRPDLVTLPIRGNVDTRLRKLDSREYDALVLAAAGLRRLGLGERITAYFEPEELCPAVGQGALAVEIRRGDEPMERTLRPLDDPMARQSVLAERAVLGRLGGGCDRPIAAHASIVRDPSRSSSPLNAYEVELRLLAVVMSSDARRLLKAHITGPATEAEALGKTVAEDLLSQGAGEILGI